VPVPGEGALRAIDSMREVYGVRRVQFDDQERTVRVEFDASRLRPMQWLDSCVKRESMSESLFAAGLKID